MKVGAGGLPWTHARNVAAVFLQIIRNLDFVELSGDPEIGEEKNHQAIQRKVKRIALAQVVVGEIFQKTQAAVSGAKELKDFSRKHQDGLGKNDGHDPRIVDP